LTQKSDFDVMLLKKIVILAHHFRNLFL